MIQKLLYVVLALGVAACHSPSSRSATTAASLGSDRTPTEVVVHLENWSADDLPEPVEVQVQRDHSLRTAKQYEAYPLRPILDQLIVQYNLDTTTSEVVLACKDGYTASNTLQELYSAAGGYLAFRDLEAPAGKNWLATMAARYAPYHLVWKDIPYDDHPLTWPYGLVTLQFSTNDPYTSLYPHNQPALAVAVEHYKHHCLKCHSLNKLGGTVGPEFNVPKNITEYWTRDNIVSYAQNPQSFRYNSKMYAIESLSEAELHGVVSYLAYMANHKKVSK